MRIFNPSLLLILSFTIWIFFYINIPASYLYKGSAFFSKTILFLYVAFFLLGTISIKLSKTIKASKPLSLGRIKQITILLFCLGAVGVLIKLYTGFFITKIFVAKDAFSKRQELFGSEFNSGIYGVISAVLFPFAVICMLITIYYFKNFKKSFMFLSILFGMYPFLETFFMGGRTVIALLGTTTLITIFFSIEKNTNFKKTIIKLYKTKLFSIPSFLLKKKILISVSIVSIVFVSYSVKIITDRLSAFGYKDTLVIWEGYHQVDIHSNFEKEVKKSLPKDKNFKIGIYSLKHYFVHGVFEYIRLVNHLEKTTGYYYGAYEFYVFFKFFKIFGIPIPSFLELNSISYKPAVYTTFFGPFYIDFGVFGIFVMFFWGRFTKKIYIKARQGCIQYLILSSFFSTVIVSSFFINFLMGSASYYLFSFLITILIFKLWPNKLRTPYN